MQDIANKEDLKELIDQFYSKVKVDQTIGPVFQKVIVNDDWSEHLPVMYSFWNTVLFGVSDYRGNPFSKHIPLNLEKPHFDKWIELFINTISELFEGPKAEEAKERAQNMRLLFEHKLEHIRSNPNSHPIL